MKSLALLLAVNFIFVIPSFAQNPEWIVYNTSNSGLPDNQVIALAIDGSNRWIGTHGGGLAKFDFTNWTVYDTTNSGLPHNIVGPLAIDGSNIWIGANEGGLAKFDGTNWTVYDTTNSGLPHIWVRALAIDGSNIWIGTYSGGVAKFDGTNWTVYDTTNSGLPENECLALAIGGSNIWIGSWGLAKFDGTNWTVYNESNSGLPYNRVYALAIDGSDNIWIGTYGGGLAKFDGTNWTVYNTSNSGLPHNLILSLAIDGSNIWIGTWGGLAKFDGTNWTVYNESNSGLPDNWVYALAIDGSDNIWIGTWLGGLAVYREGGVIIPVELTAFTASTSEGKIYLNWATATELNNLGFEIERKILNNHNEGEWVRIGFVEGHGTTTETKEYSYIDDINAIQASSLVYRLKQIDFLGSYEYSDEVYVESLAPTDFVLEQNYPNPFNPSTSIKYGVAVKSHIVIKVFNALGSEVAILVNEEKSAGTYEVEFDATALPSGVYFYRLQAVPTGRQAGSFIETKKMLLLK